MKKARFLVSPQTGEEFFLVNMHEEGGILTSGIKIWKRGCVGARAESGGGRRKGERGSLHVIKRRNSGGILAVGTVKVKTRLLAYC